MHAEGTLEIAAAREATWDAVTDPQVLAPCVPGGGSLVIERADATVFTLRGRIGQGFLSLPVEGQVELSGLQRPSVAQAALRGSLAGTSLDATMLLALEDVAPGYTRLRWAADSSIVGPLAGMAQPYLDREGPGAIERTLECLRSRLEAGTQGGAA